MALKLDGSGEDASLTFCKHFLQVLRLVRLYDTDNVNFQDPLTKFQKVVIGVSDRMGSARLQADEGMLYFNKDPVRGGRRAFGIITGVNDAMEKLGIAEIAFTGAMSIPELRGFFGLLRLPEGVADLDVQSVKDGIKTNNLTGRVAVYMPGETTGAATIQQVEIDEKTYFPLAYARTLVLLRELRGDLDWIIMKAVEKERERRYATTADFADGFAQPWKRERAWPCW